MQGLKGAELTDLLKISPAFSKQMPMIPAEYDSAGRFDQILQSHLDIQHPSGEKNPMEELGSSEFSPEPVREHERYAPPEERFGTRDDQKPHNEAVEKTGLRDKEGEKSSEKNPLAFNSADKLRADSDEAGNRINKDSHEEKTTLGLKEKASRNARGSLGKLLESAAREIQGLLALVPAHQGNAQALREFNKELNDAAGLLRRHGTGAERELAERLAKRLLGARKALAAADLPRNVLGALDHVLARVKGEIEKRIDPAQRHVKKQEKFSGESQRDELESPAGRERLREKAFFIQGAAREDSREGASARNGNDSSAFSLHHMKGTQRNEASQLSQNAAHRGALFDEQLESILQGARIAVRDGRNASMDLRLHPESLGRMNIKLALEDGTLIGRFLVESTDARDAILERITTIREELAGSGISVGEFQVNVRDERGRFVREEADERRPRVSHMTEASSASGVYETGSAIAHDGAIDVII